jgi:hypothetical protein
MLCNKRISDDKRVLTLITEYMTFDDYHCQLDTDIPVFIYDFVTTMSPLKTLNTYIPVSYRTRNQDSVRMSNLMTRGLLFQ